MAALAGACLLFLRVLISTAWQCDDAYITHRSAANWLSGHGPVFNPGERVQAFTHPLWMGLSALCQGLAGEAYFSVLVVSIGLSLLAALLLARAVAVDRWAGVLAVLAMSASGAIVDFGTSGLETPLLYVLVGLGLAMADPAPGPRGVGAWALLCAAVGLVRLDALLLLGPAAVLCLGRVGRRAWPAAALGALPLLAWEIFSLVYYGSLVPNTALAKLNLDIPRTELAARGMAYLADSARHDPLSLGLPLLGAGLALWRGRGLDRALALGLLLDLAYVVAIGGDFMSGRFLAAPALLGLGLALRQGPLPLPSRVLAALGLAALGILGPSAPWRSGRDHGEGWTDARLLSPSGVADERAYYYPTAGLLPVLARRAELAAGDLPIPPDPGAIAGLAAAAEPPGLLVSEQVGFYAYFAGPQQHVVDRWCLGDPLLARLPFQPSGPWRAGHYLRPLPAGYLDSVATGRNLVRDPAIARLYADVRQISRGPMFTRARWAAIARQGFGLRGTAAP